VVSVRSSNLMPDAHGVGKAELTLQVQLPEGKPYVARVTRLVELAFLQQIQPGKEVSIKIDRDDPQVIYPNVGWAKYS
jgi:hypothetical protein